MRLIDDVEIEDDPVDEPEFWLFETKLLTEFDLLPLLLFDDEEETDCPVTKPCKISAKFLALAYFKRNTFKPPKRSADGTSSI